VTRTILLDSGPLGLLAHPRLSGPIEDWISSLLQSGTQVGIPEIVYYELRRELSRLGNALATRRLDELIPSLLYVPLNKPIILRASELWAQARRDGKPTADDKALDIDVLLAATALEIAQRGGDVVVATTNVGHLARFVPAALWTEIKP
jgi:predicted nucleic acid-binding protein